ncbi:hypothetical protein [Sphingomonas hankookensis]|uniref:hypothetical protein n=1 Tax=Sphingomonas hankookensis TaxID=563996 RepID=UPI00269BB1AD
MCSGTRDILDDFAAALATAMTRVRATGRVPVSLCDYSGAKVHSQDVVAGFVEMMQNPAIRLRRVAV